MSDSRGLAQELYEIRALALSHATSPQLGVSSVDGEGLVFRDGDGNDIGRIGGDGNGVEFEYLYGPKPPQPSAPDVAADTNLLSVRWDGLWADQSETDPDIVGSPVLDRVEVHVSSDENFVPDQIESLAGTMPVLDSGGQILVGPLAEAGDWYVVLLARGKDGQYGAPSDRVHVVTSVGLVENELFDLALRAGEAMESADGKNSVYYGDTEPEPQPRLDEDGEPILDDDGNPLFNEFTEGDIWFGPGNMPHVWSETDGWVSAADERVDAIQSAVEDLESALDDVVVGAGGTKNFYQTEPPLPTDDPAPAEGDLWFDQNDQNKPYIFRDGEWVSIRDDSFLSTAKNLMPWDTSGNVHALNGQTFTIPSAEMRAQAGVVPGLPTLEPLGVVVGDGENRPASSAITRLPFQGALDASNELQRDATAVPYEGRPLGVTAQALFTKVGNGASSGSIRAWATFYDVEGNILHSESAGVNARPLDPDDPQEDVYLSMYGMTHIAVFEDVIELPESLRSEAVSFAMHVELRTPSVAGSTAMILALEARVQVPEGGIAAGAITEAKLAAEAVTETKIAPDSVSSPKIVAGAVQTAHLTAEAVTAEKIATGTITAESGIIGSLDAGKITVGELDGARIKAGSVQADLVLIEGSVGSTLIREGAITTDKIQAGAVTTEKITAGGIDAGVITTGELRGELIRAESIAASALAATAIDGKTITGATVRTAAAGARVEMTPDGLRQYNEFNQPIVEMVGGSATFMGALYSGPAGGSRVQIDPAIYSVPGQIPPEAVPDSGGYGAGIRLGRDQANGIDLYYGMGQRTASEILRTFFISGPAGAGRSSFAMSEAGSFTLSATNSGAAEHSASLSISTDQFSGSSTSAFKRQSPRLAWQGVRGGQRLTMMELEANTNNLDRGTVKILAFDHTTGEEGGIEAAPQGTSGWGTFFLGSRRGPNGTSGVLGTSTGVTVQSGTGGRLELTHSGIGRLTATGDMRLSSSATMYSTATTQFTWNTPRIAWANAPVASGGTTLAILSNGRIGKSSSSRRYKVAEEPLSVTDGGFFDRLLSVEPKTWYDRAEVEYFADVVVSRQRGVDIDPDWVNAGPIRRQVGAIAEDLHEAGLGALVSYTADGEPESIMYDRIGAVLIPVVRGLRDRINELEEKIGEWEND